MRASYGGHAMDALVCANPECARPLEQPERGRPKEFCDDRCRKRAARAKQQRQAAVDVSPRRRWDSLWDLLRIAPESAAISALAGVDRRSLLHLRAILQRAV